MYNVYFFDDADLPAEVFEPGYEHPINIRMMKIKVEMDETKGEVKRQKLKHEGWGRLPREKEEKKWI